MSEKKQLELFTDGSVNTLSKIGYGAYLVVSDSESSFETLNMHVKVKRFTETNSTKLELETLLWAFSEIQIDGYRVLIYTDSQNILSLPGRRDRLEQNDYRSKNNKHISNFELYREFYRITDQIDCKFIKVKGHRVSNQKDTIEKLFTLVDRASRNALREESR